VDPRLIPINGLIALLRADGAWPALLKEQAFERFQLEAPLTTPVGDTRVDAVIYRLDPHLVLLSECKGGRNIEEEQARKYLAATADLLKRTDALPPRLRRATGVTVLPLFVGLEEHRADLEAALRGLKINAPLLTIGAQRVRLSNTSGIRGLDDFDHHHTRGLPPARFRVDHQSLPEEIQEVLVPELIAAQAGARDIVALEGLAAAVISEWDVLAHGARRDSSVVPRRSFAASQLGRCVASFALSQAGAIAEAASSSNPPPLRRIPVVGLRPGRRSSDGLLALCGVGRSLRSRAKRRSTISLKREG